jgi:OHS family lactose permease-like MFS transporter
MPWFVNRTGAKWALIIAGLIMSVRIVGSAIPLGPVWIGAVKMMHALEKPLILVSVFKFIAANFDHKLSSTVYLLVLFVASIATAIYSPLAGYLYDTIGFAHTYLILGSIAGLFTLISIFTLRDKRDPPPQVQHRQEASRSHNEPAARAISRAFSSSVTPWLYSFSQRSVEFLP